MDTHTNITNERVASLIRTGQAKQQKPCINFKLSLTQALQDENGLNRKITLMNFCSVC